MHRTDGGRTLGRVRAELSTPPPAPPPVPIGGGARVGSSGQPWREVLREMVVAFKTATRGANMRALMDRIDGAWESRVKEVVGLLMDEGMSGGTYVAFACGQVEQLRGRPPFAAEIFSPKSARGWMLAYRKDAAGLVGRAYGASEDRRRQCAAILRDHLRG